MSSVTSNQYLHLRAKCCHPPTSVYNWKAHLVPDSRLQTLEVTALDSGVFVDAGYRVTTVKHCHLITVLVIGNQALGLHSPRNVLGRGWNRNSSNVFVMALFVTGTPNGGRYFIFFFCYCRTTNRTTITSKVASANAPGSVLRFGAWPSFGEEGGSFMCRSKNVKKKGKSGCRLIRCEWSPSVVTP